MSISSHYPVLVVVVPLVGAYFMPLFWRWKKALCKPAAALSTALPFLMSLDIALKVLKTGALSYFVGSWKPPWGIEIYVDYLSAYLLVIVSGVGFLIVFYSTKYAEKKIEEKNLGIFFTLSLLLLAGLTGMVVTGDLFNLFVFVEISSLAAYALVTIAGEKGPRGHLVAGFSYFYLGALGSSSLLLATGLAYMVTGTLNMADLALRLHAAGEEYRWIIIASLVFFILGFSVKAALFPLHLWLPDAHSLAPSPASALLSGLVIEVNAYALLRLFYSVFGIEFVSEVGVAFIMQVLSALAVIIASFLALAQSDSKRMLAYSSIVNVGYIMLGATLTTKNGLSGSLFHLLHHSISKSALFLAVGVVMYKTGKKNIGDFKGLGKKMPFTMLALSMAALSMIGFPPLSGFVGKWLFVVGTLEGKRYVFTFVIFLGSFLSALYFIRWINYIYFKESEGENRVEREEAPLIMLIPVLILALSAIFLGIFAELPLSLVKRAVAFYY